MQRILVGVAAYNDAEGLREILPLIPRQIGEWKIDVLVVDDGSTDDTTGVALEHGCHLVSHHNNIGHGRTRKSALGFAISGGYDHVITMDGDTQHDPAYLPRFIQALQDGFNLVRASRYHPESPSDGLIPAEWLRLNKEATEVINQLTGWNLTDALCGMMGFPTSLAIEVLPELKWDDYGYIIEVLLRIRHRFPDLRVLEIPHPSVYGGTRKLNGLYGQDLTPRIKRFAQHMEQIEQLRVELGL